MERAPRYEATALVVDDDMVLRSMLAELLEEEGFLTVIQASNGFSGLRLALEHRPQFILLDLLLPELSGVDVLRELRSRPGTRDTAIVAVTGSPDQLTDAQLAQLDGVIRKPFDVDSFLSTVYRAVKRAGTRASEVQPIIPAAPGLRAHGRSEVARTPPPARRARRYRI
jgi:CheY-like chemotaxis protein